MGTWGMVWHQPLLVYENRKVFIGGWFSVMAGERRARCTSSCSLGHGNPFKSGLAMSWPKILQHFSLSPGCRNSSGEKSSLNLMFLCAQHKKALLPHFCWLILLFFLFFLLLNYENTAVLSWMDDSLAQLLLKIQINSLSLLFMNHKQERKAALKGHFVNMSPGKCPTPDSGRHNKINKYFLKKILIFCFPVGFIIQQPDLQPPCNSTDKSNGCSLKDLEFRIVELRLEKTSVHH